eukprot:364861-Chlamydomonas_euryale.AAC.11
MLGHVPFAVRKHALRAGLGLLGAALVQADSPPRLLQLYQRQVFDTKLADAVGAVLGRLHAPCALAHEQLAAQDLGVADGACGGVLRRLRR